MQKIVAKVNLGAIADNARYFRKLTGARLCAVVKADAYGHGSEAVACALEGIADMFAVALSDEGKALRTAACGKPVLVLTPPADYAEAEALVEGGFIASVPDLWRAKLLAEAAERKGKEVAVHLQANTGMNRYGTNLPGLGRICRFLKGHPLVRAEGVYSHLYSHSREESERQRRLFVRAGEVCEKYYPGLCKHLSATYGALLGGEFSFDMVRIGLGLYGYLPEGSAFRPPLKKAMKVYARTIQSRRYSRGGAGYGEPPAPLCRGEKMTVLRAGYADGFFRSAANVGTGEANGTLSPLCMDACVVRGGTRPGGIVPVMTDADKAAADAGTISYEILCAVTRRAEFVYEYE